MEQRVKIEKIAYMVFFCHREQSKSRILSVNWKSRVLLYRSKLLDSPEYTDPPAAMNEFPSFFYYFGLIEKKYFNFLRDT